MSWVQFLKMTDYIIDEGAEKLIAWFNFKFSKILKVIAQIKRFLII